MIRIRVRPNYGLGAYGGMGGYGVNRFGVNAHQRVAYERKLNSTRLNMERALWAERLKRAQLEAALQYGGAGVGAAGIVNPYAMGGALVGARALTAGVIPAGFGVVPGMGVPATGFGGLAVPGMLGSGQSNVTNQSGQTGGAPLNQSVSNANTYNSYVMGGGSGWGGYPAYNSGGGFLSGLLGWL